MMFNNRPDLEMTSWHIASEMVRHRPSARVYLWHPGGGQYDMLTVYDDEAGATPNETFPRIDMNRTGTIHLHSRPSTSEHVSWNEYFEFENSAQAIEGFERKLGWRSSAKTPPSTQTVLAYRVISSLIQHTIHTPQELHARMAFLDTSGYVLIGEGETEPKSGSLKGFEHAERFTSGTVAKSTPWSSFVNLWMVLDREGRTVLCIHDTGIAFHRDGRETDLMSAYKKNKRNLTALVLDEFTQELTASS